MDTVIWMSYFIIIVGHTQPLCAWLYLWTWYNYSKTMENLLYIQVGVQFICHILYVYVIYTYYNIILIVETIWHRNPHQRMKRNIQDWHLMLIVLTLLLISTSIFCLYILLQGTIAKFTVDKIPHKEKPFRIEGVRK